MSQFAYGIPNEPGINFRSDVNNAIQAAITQNSGPTEPSVKFAFMFWADTSVTPVMLRQRDAGNANWLAVMQLNNLAMPSTQTLAATAVTLTGSAGAYVGAQSPATSGPKIVHATVNSATLTGASTLAMNGDASKVIKQYTHTGTKIAAVLVAGMLAVFQDDGTNWMLMNPLSNSNGGATGGGDDAVFQLNKLVVTNPFTIPSDSGASCVGTIVFNATVTFAGRCVFL
jgi:hypothetical protein